MIFNMTFAGRIVTFGVLDLFLQNAHLEIKRLDSFVMTPALLVIVVRDLIAIRIAPKDLLIKDSFAVDYNMEEVWDMVGNLEMVSTRRG